MAMRDEIREQKKLLKGKGAKAYLQWFKDYQLLPTVIIVFAAVMVIYLVVTMVTAKDSVFGVMFINASVADDQSDILEEDFMAYAGIDESRYEVYMDLSESHSISESETTMDMYSTQAIFTRLAAGQIDVVAADPYMFAQYAGYGYFVELTEVLDEETLSEFDGLLYYVERSVLEEGGSADGETASEEDASEETAAAAGDEESGEEDDGLVSLDEIQESEETAWTYQNDEELVASYSIDSYVLPDPADMEDPVAVGVVVNGSPYLKENHNYDDYVCLLGFVNGSDTEYCRLFFDYLFENS